MTISETLKRSIPPVLQPRARAILSWYRRVVLRRYRLARGPVGGRRRAMAAEVRFWDDWLDRNSVDLAGRLDPKLTDPVVLACLERITRSEVSIIDVGAGPLTTLGTEAPAKRVSLTAVDALGDEYARLLAAHSITPIAATQQCSGEDLLTRFEPETVDIAFAENALDHAADPLRIIQNMVTLVRPGGFVVLRHNANEAESAYYGHLHQWNFEERNARCFLWREGAEHDLAAELPDAGELDCRTVAGADAVRRVECVIGPKPG